MSLDAAAYARQLKALLPRGPLWALDVTSELHKLMLGLAEELARVDARSDALVEELDPRTTTECIDDWERMLGLPDDAFPAGASLAERRISATTKYASRGGATGAYFISVANRMGFVATYDEPAVYTWRLTIDVGASSSPYPYTESLFRVPTARMGDHLAWWGVAVLEAVMDKLKPAHTVCRLKYINVPP